MITIVSVMPVVQDQVCKTELTEDHHLSVYKVSNSPNCETDNATAPLIAHETNGLTTEEPYPGFEAQVQQILKDADAIQDEGDRHRLCQLQKMTVTQAKLNRYNRRNKWFLGALLGTAAAMGTLFNLGLSSVNSVSLSTLRQHVREIQNEIPQLREQLSLQGQTLQTIGKSLKGTLVVLNTHSVLLNQTLNSIKQLYSILQNDVAQTQLVTALMSDMLREVSSSIDSLAMGRIPPYLVPISLVQAALSSTSTHSLIPFKPISPTHWEDPSYFISTWTRVHTPEVVAYHDSNPQLYLAPNLSMCTRTKDIHYLCPSKLFLRVNTEGICGLQPMQQDTRCPAEAKPRSQVTDTQAEIVGDKWLVNTPIRTATLTYDKHDTATRVSLPNQNMWIQVPKGAILHLGDLALFHLPSEEYQSEVEITDIFKNHNLTLGPELELRIEEGGGK
ncbi:hypothetical protein HF521_016843 [Silurus meridionalis]|uniref:Uncharacterized protein n=1 Tax=Silurus meridionalis TaxID=175797 RepID=A0A8T0BU91_SILME|nr:hypothetical protein HF521_016843 [Silurus meridionalis]